MSTSRHNWKHDGMRWGDRLEFTAEAGPGDFIYFPPYVPHQEINASDTEPHRKKCIGSTTFIRRPRKKAKRLIH